MAISIAQIGRWRDFWKEQAWENLDSEIPYEDAIKGVFPDVSHFKIMAMANLTERRETLEFVELVQCRLKHLEHKSLYLSMLVDSQMALQRFEQAIDALEQLREFYPDSPRLFEQMVQCAKHLQREELVEYAQGKFEFSVGKELSRRLQFEDAVPYLRAADGRVQADPRCGWLYGQALMLSGDYEGASACLSRGNHSPEYLNELRYAKLQLSLKRRDVEVAGNIASDILADRPSDIGALRALALIQEWQGHHLAAIETYHRITQHYPFDVPATLKAIHIAHGLLESAGNTLSAITDSQRLIIASVFIDAGYADAGLKVLQSIKRESAEFEKARLLEIDQIIKQREFEKALIILNEELEHSADNDEYLARAAQCQCSLGNYEEAEFLASQASEINFNNVRNHFWLAESQYQQCANGKSMTVEQLEWVIVMYQSYAQHFPRDGFPLMRIADTYQILRQYHRIKEYIVEARSRGHTSPRAAYLMGKYWQAEGNLKEAIKEFTHAIELQATGDFFWAHYDRAKTALQDRNLQLAMQDARHLASMWPDDDRIKALMKSVHMEATKKRR